MCVYLNKEEIQIRPTHLEYLFRNQIYYSPPLVVILCCCCYCNSVVIFVVFFLFFSLVVIYLSTRRTIFTGNWLQQQPLARTNQKPPIHSARNSIGSRQRWLQHVKLRRVQKPLHTDWRLSASGGPNSGP